MKFILVNIQSSQTLQQPADIPTHRLTFQEVVPATEPGQPQRMMPYGPGSASLNMGAADAAAFTLGQEYELTVSK